MFKHFILTRFNLKTDHIPGRDKNNQPVLTTEWLERRFFLFEKYCLPSMMNQSCKNFIWFVLFSNNTPERFLEKIRNYESKFPNLKPLFLEPGGLETIKKKFNEMLPDYLSNDDRYIITTRIDNDDAFHKDMILEVQSLFDKQEDVFISFIYGLQYDIQQKVLVRMHYENNHFISRIEKLSSGVDTVIAHDHTAIQMVSDVNYIRNRNKPMWLEIIHDGNIINSLNPSSTPFVFSTVLASFHLEERISLLNSSVALIRYIRIHLLLARAALLKKLGIYDLLKRGQEQQNSDIKIND